VYAKKKIWHFYVVLFAAVRGASPMQTTQIDAIFHKPLIRLNLRANFKALPPLPPENLA